MQRRRDEAILSDRGLLQSGERGGRQEGTVAAGEGRRESKIEKREDLKLKRGGNQ